MASFDAKADAAATAVAAGDKIPFGDVDADGWDTITAAKTLAALAAVTDDAAGVRTALSVPSAAAVAAGYQPLDADLTAIAALTTTSFGRSLLTPADAAAGRTLLGAIGGSTGSTDNALLRANGAGGGTAQATGIVVDDANAITRTIPAVGTDNSIEFAYTLDGLSNDNNASTPLYFCRLFASVPQSGGASNRVHKWGWFTSLTGEEGAGSSFVSLEPNFQVGPSQSYRLEFMYQVVQRNGVAVRPLFVECDIGDNTHTGGLTNSTLSLRVHTINFNEPVSGGTVSSINALTGSQSWGAYLQASVQDLGGGASRHRFLVNGQEALAWQTSDPTAYTFGPFAWYPGTKLVQGSGVDLRALYHLAVPNASVTAAHIVYKDATPTRAWAWGSAVVGSAPGNHFVASYYNGSVWGERLRIEDTNLVLAVPLTPRSMADSAAPNGTLYYSTDAAKLVFKDSGGVVNNLY